MLLSLSLVLLAGAVQDPPPRPALPAELVAYYTDYNFVNAFSTRFERRTLASRSRGRMPEADGRLRAVRERMERLAAKVRELDPGILADRGDALPFALRADLLEVRSYQVDEAGGDAVVELDVIALE